ASADPDPRPFFDRLRAARALAAQGELQAARLEFQSLDLEMHGHPSAIWSLAQIAARLGEPEEAMHRLEEYAAMGLARSPRRDSSFTALVGNPRFEAVAKRLDENAGAIPRPYGGPGHVRFASLDDPSLLVEDLALDYDAGVTYVSSIHRRKVLVVSRDGSIRDLFPPAQNGVWGIYGLALDRSRGRLWGSTAASPLHENYESADSGRTAVVAWDIETGKEQFRVELPRDGKVHVLGDITLGEDGTLYASDSVGGGLYALRHGAAAFDTLAPTGTFGSPQGILELEPGRMLLVADYPRGLLLYDLKTRSAEPVAKPRHLALTGIDGMCRLGSRYGGGIVAAQNGVRPQRILSLHYTPEALRRASTPEVTGPYLSGHELERLDPSLGETSHVVPDAGHLLLIGNSGWERVNERDELQTDDKSSPPFLFAIEIPYR
ncbi:MAG TPA: hypothetical protein VFM17_03105, partial [Candidatus Eisenbacteria bacterium]|nr:hypothetical protein [Candidatus Eisenbacteria bacterium]